MNYIKPFFLIGLISTFLSLFSCSTKEERANRYEKLDSTFTHWEDTKSFNGNLLIITGDTQIVYSKGYSHMIGMKPLKSTDAFYLASLSKEFTAVAILSLVEKDSLNLSDTLGAKMAELPEYMHSVSIRQLLNHTSGIPDYYERDFYQAGMTNKMVLDSLETLDSLDFSPGSSFSYSNSGYVILSVLLERITGKSFKNYMYDEFFGPLGMKSTRVYDISKPFLPPRAIGHSEKGFVTDYNALTTGGGGIYSNLEDIQNWLTALDSGRLIGDTLLEEMYKPAVLSAGDTSYYGFGWFLDSLNRPIYQHSGSLRGFRNYLYRDQQEELTILMMSNFTQDVGSLVEDLKMILYK